MGGASDDDIPGWLRCCGFGNYSYSRAKWNYLALFGVSVSFMWIVRDFGEDMFSSASKFDVCQQARAAEERTGEEFVEFCYGKEAVLRLAFATFLFFATHAVALATVKFFSPGHALPRQIAHAGFFPLRVLLWVGLVCLCFFTMSSSVFDGFFQFARVAAAAYLLLQVVVLLEFVFAVNEMMIDRDECKGPLIALTAGLFAVSVAGIVLLYRAFAPRAGCGTNIFLITFTLILSVAVVGLSVSPVRSQAAGLMTGLMVTTYGVYLCATALYSAPADSCTDLPFDGQTTWLTVVGFVLVLFVLVVAVVNLAANHAAFVGGGAVPDPDAVPEDDDLPYSATFFHVIFALATCFMVMLFTNWSLLATPGDYELDQGSASMWIKVVTQWLCFLLYGWMLIAPRVLADRVF